MRGVTEKGRWIGGVVRERGDGSLERGGVGVHCRLKMGEGRRGFWCDEAVKSWL